uniref:histidine kinase n=1 Tax=Desulfomonile tiedjei TaxID=2358 RepID=A0A7C4ARX1_9BACT
MSKMGRLKEVWTAQVRSLGFRISLSVCLILLASYVIFLYLLTGIQSNFAVTQLMNEADLFSKAVINATNHSMLRDDTLATSSIVTDVGKQEEIAYVRIFNHDGIIKFSNHVSEIGDKADMNSRVCAVCHAGGVVSPEITRTGRTVIDRFDSSRLLVMITPIYNKVSCSSAACHVHPASHRVLGIMEVAMSLDKTDRHLRDIVLKIILLGVGTFIAVFATIGLYIMLRVNRPLRRLRDGTKKIAQGDFTCKLPVESQDEIGECARAFNIMGDQIRRRTQELVKSRWEYKNLFEQVPCFICVINKDFEIVRQNSYMRNLFKGSIGMHCYEVFKKRSEKCEDCHADRCFIEKGACSSEECGITVSGEEANYISYMSPVLNDKNEVLYTMIIAVDIRERVKLEKELRVTKDFQTNLIDNSIHGIIAIDEKGAIAIYNQAAENLLGYPQSDVLGDKDLEKYFPRQFVEMILASHLGKELETTRLVAQEASIKSKSGEDIPVRFSGAILYDQGKTVGAVGFYQDLRTFKKLEREKKESDRLAVIGQTVAGLAHGIKNILQGLEGGVFVVQTAIEDSDKALLERGWDMVQNNIRRISDLVKDLLSYSKERVPQYEEVDPNKLVEEVCALFEPMAAKKSIVIERQLDKEIDESCKLLLDQRGIHTCLSNLVSNAIDACESDAKDVQHRVIVKTELDSECWITFQVSDNGGGMSEDTKRKIFSSFYSTKGSRGTGLGLLVTSKIVLEHGGELFFESQEGEGTTFTMRLPAHGQVQPQNKLTP